MYSGTEEKWATLCLVTSFYSETSCFVPIKGAESCFTSVLQALLFSICFHSPPSSALLCNMSSTVLDLWKLSPRTCAHVVSFFLPIWHPRLISHAESCTYPSACLSCVNYLYRLETHIYSILIYTLWRCNGPISLGGSLKFHLSPLNRFSSHSFLPGAARSKPNKLVIILDFCSSSVFKSLVFSLSMTWSCY